MSSTRRHVPTTYQELSHAVTGGLYPAERSWIDFKRELYPAAWPPDAQTAAALKEKKHRDISCDMAAMAVYGGWLVLGVQEDKKAKSFALYPIDLAGGLRETVDALAQNRVSPPLYVEITEVEDPADPGRGFLVIEIPESPHAPHQADGSYWGRSDTGNVRLVDAEVERLMLERARRGERITAAMRITAEADPVPVDDRDVAHAYFTAIPTRGRPGMFDRWTRDAADLNQLCRTVAAEARNATIATAAGNVEVVYSQPMGHHRSARAKGSWLTSYTGGQAREGCAWMVGVGDDGAVRMIDGAAGSTEAGMTVLFEQALAAGARYDRPSPGRRVFQEAVRMRVIDMLYLVAELSEQADYSGSWTLGVEIDRLKGHVGDLPGRFPRAFPAVYDDEEFSHTATVTRKQLSDDVQAVATTLMRPLYRELDVEILLPGPR